MPRDLADFPAKAEFHALVSELIALHAHLRDVGDLGEEAADDLASGAWDLVERAEMLQSVARSQLRRRADKLPTDPVGMFQSAEILIGAAAAVYSEFVILGPDWVYRRDQLTLADLCASVGRLRIAIAAFCEVLEDGSGLDSSDVSCEIREIRAELRAMYHDCLAIEFREDWICERAAEGRRLLNHVNEYRVLNTIAVARRRLHEIQAELREYLGEPGSADDGEGDGTASGMTKWTSGVLCRKIKRSPGTLGKWRRAARIRERNRLEAFTASQLLQLAEQAERGNDATAANALRECAASSAV